jgi:hypothetical protein
MSPNRLSSVLRTSPGRPFWLAGVLVATAGMTHYGVAAAAEPEFTRNFNLEDCTFKSVGANPYFILRPGYRLTLEGEDDGLAERVRISVLSQVKDITVPGIGTVRTRVVEEKEWSNETLIERSLNYFAICGPTNDVFYFGEDVDIFEDDGTVSHDGAWLAGRDGAKPGLIMPGRFLLGSRYYQEVASGIALDRAEHVKSGLAIQTGEGRLNQCVKVIETTPLERGESEKIYCRGVGLVFDSGIVLTDIDEPGDD